ncbi:MAG: M20 aminoacylase family protein [Roseibium album]|uniref:Putative hydrolase YxeP n=1 Tax=Roseibium album TaxID=311410 RepID=A0A0M6Z9G6_9HYPH|nr:M20 aminoacylase family protein [Roseibium album]MBG6144268.1 hippurate hydrolase [Labrenzia sp. EL_142]MBG6157255.1 hippurate hydrolase [Labrenzia sp. EL_162]MBG6162616.1 hippurate hydrolase [Labrenzia sp. EL_195]MBG6196351.1 hippurate hydrolase [Labrenzia sp. EL_159]MBG6207779.1 hippurate hydrolase [Labrenzia sp. EL_126]MCR9057075.1 M20 family metallopeptidase [Paracoccaceae bacterium]
MPIVNRLADLADEITVWRRDFHENPEILYETVRTAEKVAELLESFGVDEVTTGIGKTGVVGVIKGRNGGTGRTVGLRADMDALPIEEATQKPYASKIPGKMHACGHDGHTAMLLGAAKYLSETRNFDGTVVVIFQPAEEGGAGAKAMIDDGLMTRWPIDEVYGMHNYPGMPVGEFAIRKGPIMAATDEFRITITGKGGHAAKPHQTIDPVVVGSKMVSVLQTIASRNANPLDSVVVSVTVFNAGNAFNVIPQEALLRGTVRTLSPEMRDLAEERMNNIVRSIAEAFDARAELEFRRGYPVTANHDDQTDFAAEIAEGIAGDGKVNRNIEPMMGGEDFSYMLEERPGAFIFAGNGDTAGLHHPEYDFNDDLIPVGCSYWVKLVETALPAKAA